MSSLQALQFEYNTVQIINYTPYHKQTPRITRKSSLGVFSKPKLHPSILNHHHSSFKLCIFQWILTQKGERKITE